MNGTTLMTGNCKGKSDLVKQLLLKISAEKGVEVLPDSRFVLDTEGIQPICPKWMPRKEAHSVDVVINVGKDANGKDVQKMVATVLKSREPNKNMRIYLDSVVSVVDKIGEKHDPDKCDDSRDQED